jgi:uncharacterized short protein YbdD (DUF466 family)
MPRETESQVRTVAGWPWVRGLLGAVRQIVGAPDYQRYLEHHATRHPGSAPLSPRDFYAEFLMRQFGSGGPTRCC